MCGTLLGVERIPTYFLCETCGNYKRTGRRTRRYCSRSCKNAAHYRKKKQKERLKKYLEMNGTYSSLIVRVVENSGGAIVAVNSLLEMGIERAVPALEKLDRLNIRGEHLWLAYKDLCMQDGRVLLERLDTLAEDLEALDYGGYVQP